MSAAPEPGPGHAGSGRRKAFLAAAAAFAAALAFALPIRFVREETSGLYDDPRPVEVQGYDADAMEPFLSPDGRFLFFNSSNAPGVDTDIHFASRAGPLAFRLLGEPPGVNSKSLDGVPGMDAAGRFYFTSVREYPRTLRSVFAGDFDGQRVLRVRSVEGDIQPPRIGSVNMDVGISLDGRTMYISRAWFLPLLPLPPIASDLLVAARREDGSFLIDPRGAEIMRKVNTRALEYAPAISPDGLELYFTRADIPGGLRIMVARRRSKDAPFEEARVLSGLTTGEVEAPTVSTDLSELFYHKKVAGKWRLFRAARRLGAG